MLIGLVGYAGAGKDTAADLLCGHANFRRVAFADKVKELALALDANVGGRYLSYWVEADGWDHAKQRPEVRQHLQDLGKAVRDVLHDQVWIAAALGGRNEREDVVVTDVRYPNEVEAIRARGGVIVLVRRPGVGPANDHESEQLPGSVTPEWTVVNDGSLEQFALKLWAMLTGLYAQGRV